MTDQPVPAPASIDLELFKARWAEFDRLGELPFARVQLLVHRLIEDIPALLAELDRLRSLVGTAPQVIRGRCPTCGNETCLKCGGDHRFGADHLYEAPDEAPDPASGVGTAGVAMNRLWAYLEPGPDEEPRKLVYSEAEILSTYWDYWVSQMLRVHKLPMVTEANCIEDWVVLNWAWPLGSRAGTAPPEPQL